MVAGLRVGSSAAGRAYLGSTLVWQSGVGTSGPAAVVADSGQAQSGNAASLVPPTPTGVADGDLRFFFFSISNQTIETPDDVTLVHTAVVASTRRVYLFSQVYDPDALAPTFVFSAAANHGFAQVAVRRYDAAAPLDVAPVVASSATSQNTLTAPSVDPTEADTLALSFFASISNATTDTLSVPSGMAAVDAQTGTGIVGHSVLLAAEQRPTDVATGTRASTSGVSAPWAAVSLAVAPGTAGGSGAGPAAALPYLNGADWYWKPIPAAPVLDSNSANIVSVLATQKHSIATDKFAAKLVHPAEVSGSTPRYDVTFANATGGSSGLNWGPDPFGALTMPIPDGTESNIPPGDLTWVDGHIAVGDPTTNRIFALWQAVHTEGDPDPWDATWGGDPVALDGDGRENPAVGISTGAGISRFAGPIRLSEIAAGVIEHALIFGSNAVTVRGSNLEGTNWVYPATTTDGENEAAAAHTIREGARVQLDPSIDLDAIPGITPIELMIGRALQIYGAYCGDETTLDARMAFVLERPDGGTSPVYTAAGAFDQLDMTHIPWSSLRVLARWDGG